MTANKRKDFGISSFIEEAKADAESKVSTGRPARKNSLLDRKLAKLVYLDEQTEQQLKIIKAMHNYDYKETIFAAIREFMDKHYCGMGLDEEGKSKIDSAISQYKIRE